MILLNYSTKYVQNKTKHDFMVYIFDMSTTNPGNNNAIRNIINMIVKSTRLLNLDETGGHFRTLPRIKKYTQAPFGIT